MHIDESIQSSGDNNSEIIQYYISTNEVADTMNQMFRYYSTKRMIRRWPVLVFLQHDSYTGNELHYYVYAASNFSTKYKGCPPCSAYYISKVTVLLTTSCSDTYFILFVSCHRNYVQDKEILLVQFEKG